MIAITDEGRYTVKCMEAVGEGQTGAFSWPKKEDVVQIWMESIISLLPEPTPLSRRHIGWNSTILDDIDRRFFISDE